MIAGGELRIPMERLIPCVSGLLVLLVLGGCDSGSGAFAASADVPSIEASKKLAEPREVTGKALSEFSIELKWQSIGAEASPAIGYGVIRNGVRIATTLATSFHDTKVVPGTAYTYSVIGYNGLGDVSESSAKVEVQTPAASTSRVITVGPEDDFRKIESARAGDTVLIAPGVYRYRLNLTNSGTAELPIVIRALDPSNRPIFDYTSSAHDVTGWPGSYPATTGDAYRSAWRVTGAHYIIDGMIIQGANNASNKWRIHNNTAGLRYLNADYLTVRNCRFFNNDMGVQGGGSHTLIEYSEFERNGDPSSDQSHNLYILGGNDFILQYSHLHDSVGGQNFHIRARNATLAFNSIQNAADYEGDMMTNQAKYDLGADGVQNLHLIGNLVVQKPNPMNGNKLIVLYNDGDPRKPTMNLVAVGNTFVFRDPGKATDSAVVQFSARTLRGGEIWFSNNIVGGNNPRSAFMTGVGSGLPTIAGRRNFFISGSYVGPLKGSVFGRDPMFVNPNGSDYSVKRGSPAAGLGAPTLPALSSGVTQKPH